MERPKTSWVNLFVERHDMLAQISENLGEIDAEFDALLRENAIAIVEKCDRTASLINSCEEIANEAKKKADQYYALQKFCENKKKSIKEMLSYVFRAEGMTEVSGVEWRIAMKKTKDIVKVNEELDLEAAWNAQMPGVKEVIVKKYSWDKEFLFEYLKMKPHIHARLEESYVIEDPKPARHGLQGKKPTKE